MGWLHSISDWLTGHGQYMTLVHCMNFDMPWIGLTVGLDLCVAVGYAVIAVHWWKNQRRLPACPARTALATMRNIFLFCGICGYLFIPVKMVWPAWRLYDFFLAVLAFYTWRYAWNARGLRVIYTAIGESAKLEADLAVSRQELKRKSFFLNAISHDLRTPLNGLLLHANLAEIHAVSGNVADARVSITQIKDCIRITSELLDGLLEYSRLEGSEDRIKAARVDLDGLIQDVLNSHMTVATRKGLALTGQTNSGIYILTDRLKLERALNNLLSNAVKFTHAGSVKVEVGQVRDSVEIRVIDTGIGIAEADKNRLFEEFFQAHNHERDSRKGFGLGLAISRRLIQQLGGTLGIESTAGRGSQFTILLPQAIQTAGPSKSAAEDWTPSTALYQ